MKKILVLLMCVALLAGCGANSRKPNLSFTEGRVLEAGESRGMLGVEGKVTKLNDETISVNVAGSTYTFLLSPKFTKQLKEFREDGHKIKNGTYMQIYYTKEKTEGSKIYKDVYDTANVANSFAIVYEN